MDADQTAYIKGRGIYQNLRLIEDVIWLTETRKIPGAIMALDFSKAFDSISKKYLNQCLLSFGFKPDFLKWVTILNQKAQSCVLNNGWLSNWFDLERGLRQGCPLSALLFVLCVEILACKIRQSKFIKGIGVPGGDKDIRISQYADDNTLFLGDEASIVHAMSITDQFALISGLHLNREKTEAMWLGPWKDKQTEVGGIRWKTGDNKTIKILGVLFPNVGSASTVDENWTRKINNINEAIHGWNRRNISLIGRVTVVKTLLLSQITHLLMVLEPPDHIVKTLNSALFKFVWGSTGRGGEKVKRKVMVQDYVKGGVKMVTVEQIRDRFMLKWAKKILAVDNVDIPTFLHICTFVLSRFGKQNIIFYMNVTFNAIQPRILINSLPPFYKKMLNVYYNHKDVVEDVNVQDVIWNNGEVLYRGNSLFFKKWIDAGILFVNQVLDNNNVMLSLNIVQQRIPGHAHLLI
jgi:hypothetical protein